jgi:PTS system mannose-specific IIA component
MGENNNMIGILVVAHGDLADSFVKSAQMIVGKQEKVMGIGLFEGESPDTLQDGILQGIKELDGGDGVMVFVDIYGGTPSNRVAFSSAKTDSRIACITGANFPMLVDCLLTRDSLTLEQLKSHCMDTGHSGIKDLLQEITRKK